MTDGPATMGLWSRRRAVVMDTEKPDPDMPPRKDKHATPLGRGADPGPSVEGSAPDAQGIAGPRGHQTPGAQGGPSGIVDRENEDAIQKARREPTDDPA